jgi:hypothetical protein
MVCGAHLFVLSNEEQTGLELTAAAEVVMTAAVRNGSKFSQCNMAWGDFPLVRDSGC